MKGFADVRRLDVGVEVQDLGLGFPVGNEPDHGGDGERSPRMQGTPPILSGLTVIRV